MLTIHPIGGWLRYALGAAVLWSVLITPVFGVHIDTVPVGNVGNAVDNTGFGTVSYTYEIGKYEVTAGQYVAFLNAVATTDTYGLYNELMWSHGHGCKIERTGSSGSYSYTVADDYANRPVNYVSWGDAVRFANWLHNGQPTGVQDMSTTEDGAYFLDGATTDVELLMVTRESDWQWALASENEWYKAAYHKNDGLTGTYWDYATRSDAPPTRDMTEMTNPGHNANYYYQNTYLIGSPYYRTEVGEFELSTSDYGTFDQTGNVWEWNEGKFTTPNPGRCLRGGSYANVGGIPPRSSSRYCYLPTTEHAYYGFRVSTVPEPGALALFVLGGLGLLFRRRRGR